MARADRRQLRSGLDEVQIVLLRRSGERFEVPCRRDALDRYVAATSRLTPPTDGDLVAIALTLDEVFSQAIKRQTVPRSILTRCFETDDVREVIRTVIQLGELRDAASDREAQRKAKETLMLQAREHLRGMLMNRFTGVELADDEFETACRLHLAPTFAKCFAERHPAVGGGGGHAAAVRAAAAFSWPVAAITASAVCADPLFATSAVRVPAVCRLTIPGGVKRPGTEGGSDGSHGGAGGPGPLCSAAIDFATRFPGLVFIARIVEVPPPPAEVATAAAATSIPAASTTTSTCCWWRALALCERAFLASEPCRDFVAQTLEAGGATLEVSYRLPTEDEVNTMSRWVVTDLEWPATGPHSALDLPTCVLRCPPSVATAAPSGGGMFSSEASLSCGGTAAGKKGQGISRHSDATSAATSAAAAKEDDHTMRRLEAMTLKQLQQECRSRGLSTGGKAADMRERLAQHEDVAAAVVSKSRGRVAPA